MSQRARIHAATSSTAPSRPACSRWRLPARSAGAGAAASRCPSPRIERDREKGPALRRLVDRQPADEMIQTGLGRAVTVSPAWLRSAAPELTCATILRPGLARKCAIAAASSVTPAIRPTLQPGGQRLGRGLLDRAERLQRRGVVQHDQRRHAGRIDAGQRRRQRGAGPRPDRPDRRGSSRPAACRAARCATASAPASPRRASPPPAPRPARASRR